METLLEKAKSVPVAARNAWHKFDQEQFDLMYAVAVGEVTFDQAKKVLGVNKTAAMSAMGPIFASAIRSGVLVKANP